MIGHQTSQLTVHSLPSGGLQLSDMEVQHDASNPQFSAMLHLNTATPKALHRMHLPRYVKQYCCAWQPCNPKYCQRAVRPLSRKNSSVGIRSLCLYRATLTRHTSLTQAVIYECLQAPSCGWSQNEQKPSVRYTSCQLLPVHLHSLLRHCVLQCAIAEHWQSLN
jgi:hypothetical protein